MTRSWIMVGAALAAASCSQPTAPAASASSPAAAASTSPAITGKAPSGTIVTLESVPAQTYPLPDGPAVMDQYGKEFVPALLIVRVGQPVEFRNTEDSPHNVNVSRMPTGTGVFNTSTAPFQKFVHVFEQAGQYSVTCDIHPGMLATVVATTTPYVAVVDDTRAFRFPDLAAGQYTLRWNVSGRAGEKTVTVGTTAVDTTIP